MSLPEKVFREAAVACFNNAQSLLEDATLLSEHGRTARAAVLAIIGLEEFAKAIVYAVAALCPADRDVLAEKRGHLRFHEVKYPITFLAEAAQMVTRDWLEGTEWATGFRPSSIEYLATMFRQLAAIGIATLMGTATEAKDHYRRLRKDFSSSEVDFDTLAEPYKKNAALYVDVTDDGQVKTPARIDNAAGDIGSLDWFLQQYTLLPQVLQDDVLWAQFTSLVRR